MFRYRPISTEDLRAAAETLGTWDVLHDYTIYTHQVDGVHHSMGCDDDTALQPVWNSVALEDLTGTLCSCLVGECAQFRRLVGMGFQEKFLQLTLLQQQVTLKAAQYPLDPSLREWLELWNAAAGELASGITLTTVGPRAGTWMPEHTRLFRQVCAQLDESTQRPIARALVAQAMEEYRLSTLQVYLQTQPPHPSPPTHEEYLVATCQVVVNDIFTTDAGQHFLATSLVHWSGTPQGINLYRLPAWAVRLLRQKLGAFSKIALMAEPWQENLPLEVIASLWSPYISGEMKSLGSAIEAAELL